jgi:nucleotide-binding universal stress UspA family protein
MHWFWGRRRPPHNSGRRILVAFSDGQLDRVVLNAALRIARAEDATLVPAYLIVVPLTYPMDSPLHDQVEAALPILETVEDEAGRAGIAVDARMERGRSLRDALTRLWSVEEFHRVILPASTNGNHGFGERDLAWALTHAPTEMLVLRPAPEEVP